MYNFGLAFDGQKATDDTVTTSVGGDGASASAPASYVIRAPSELQKEPHRDPIDREKADSGTIQKVPSTRFGWHPSHEHQPITSLYGKAAVAEEPVHVHNINTYTDLRDAADWSVEVQREREEKKKRVLAQHEAIKLEEQRRRDAQEAQTKREIQLRRCERQGEREEQRDAEAAADFHARNTHFLRDQHRLILLGRHVAQAEEQRRMHKREEQHKNFTTSLFQPLASSECALRRAAEETEAAYIRLSLGYRKEVQCSRAAEAILNPNKSAGNSGRGATSAALSLSLPPTPCSTSSHSFSVAPPTAMPFRPAASMFTHESVKHMKQHANAIPLTYIPEYFDSPSGSKTAARLSRASYAAEAPVVSPHLQPSPQNHRRRRRRRQQQQQQLRLLQQLQTDAVMTLPLSPPPVSGDVSGDLQAQYYPWALFTGVSARHSLLPPPPPSREASLPVRQWGPTELHSTRFGHLVRPDGTTQLPCQRIRMNAERRGYSTLAQDNATASTKTELPPVHFGKRVDMWM